MSVHVIKTVGKATMYIHRRLHFGDSYRVTWKNKSASGDTPNEAVDNLIYSLGYDDEGNATYAKIPGDVTKMAKAIKDYKAPNPGSKEDAEALSEKWHGRNVESEQEIDEIVTYDEDVAELAELEELGVLAANLKDEFNIHFKRDRPRLTSTTNGQLEIIGGDQELENLNGNKRSQPIGWLIRIVYETDKHHLEDSDGYPSSYEHYFAEEFYKDYISPDDYDTPDEWWEAVKAEGIVNKAIKKELIPMLVYDCVDHKLHIVGGDYTVEDVGIKN